MKILMLDYDGTLAPFNINRHKAFPYTGVCESLNQATLDSHSKLILVSGRPISEIISLIDLKQLPEIWGCHGLERLTAEGQYELANLPLDTLQGLEKAEIFLNRMGFNEYYEKKFGSIAIHWRGLPKHKIDFLLSEIWDHLALLALRYSLRLDKFDGGIELRNSVMNKGFVVKKILSEIKEDAQIAYLGDDFTDEDAFEALKGKGLTVLVRPQFRPTLADIWLKPPDQLIKFLNCWANN